MWFPWLHNWTHWHFETPQGRVLISTVAISLTSLCSGIEHFYWIHRYNLWFDSHLCSNDTNGSVPLTLMHLQSCEAKLLNVMSTDVWAHRVWYVWHVSLWRNVTGISQWGWWTGSCIDTEDHWRKIHVFLSSSNTIEWWRCITFLL